MNKDHSNPKTLNPPQKKTHKLIGPSFWGSSSQIAPGAPRPPRASPHRRLRLRFLQQRRHRGGAARRRREKAGLRECGGDATLGAPGQEALVVHRKPHFWDPNGCQNPMPFFVGRQTPNLWCILPRDVRTESLCANEFGAFRIKPGCEVHCLPAGLWARLRAGGSLGPLPRQLGGGFSGALRGASEDPELGARACGCFCFFCLRCLLLLFCCCFCRFSGVFSWFSRF